MKLQPAVRLHDRGLRLHHFEAWPDPAKFTSSLETAQRGVHVFRQISVSLLLFAGVVLAPASAAEPPADNVNGAY